MAKPKLSYRLDLRGKVCPYPTLETRSALRKMRPGEVLEIITDYYPARQTIPKLVEDLGQKCELVEGEGNVFRLLVRRLS